MLIPLLIRAIAASFFDFYCACPPVHWCSFVLVCYFDQISTSKFPDVVFLLIPSLFFFSNIKLIALSFTTFSISVNVALKNHADFFNARAQTNYLVHSPAKTNVVDLMYIYTIRPLSHCYRRCNVDS